MRRRFDPSGPLRGTLAAPADKSLSHRAALLSAMTADPVRVTGYLDAADTNSTLDAVQALGALVERTADGLTIRGTGLRTAAPAAATIDVGNAGTLMRLLPGGSPASPRAAGRSTATSRSAAAPSTASPSRCAAWAPGSTPGRTASRRSR